MKQPEFDIAFADELHKLANADTHKEAKQLLDGTLSKEALLGIKALVKGVKHLGKGVGKGTKSKLLKAKVGLRTGKWGKSSKEMGANRYSVDRINRITNKGPAMSKKNVTTLRDSERLSRGGKSLRGKAKKTGTNIKAEIKQDIATGKAGVNLAAGSMKNKATSIGGAIKNKIKSVNKSWAAGVKKNKKVQKKIQKKKQPVYSASNHPYRRTGESKPPGAFKRFGTRAKEQAYQVAGVGGLAAGTGYLLNKESSHLIRPASIAGAVLASTVKQANLNVSGGVNSNINSTKKTPPTIKTQPAKNALPAVKAPKLKKVAAPLPLRHLGKAIKAIVGGKAQVAGKHVGHAAGSVGKTVGKVVKGTERANKKGPWYSRGNIGKKMLENKKTTGAVTTGAGAMGTKQIFGSDDNQYDY